MLFLGGDSLSTLYHRAVFTPPNRHTHLSAAVNRLPNQYTHRDTISASCSMLRRFCTAAPLRAETFSRNMPLTPRVKKQWEEKNMSKDEYYGKKHGQMSPVAKAKLEAKRARTKESREARRPQKYPRGTATPLDRSEMETRPSRRLVYEYVFGTHAALAALEGNKRTNLSRLFVSNPRDKAILVVEKAKSLGIPVDVRSNKRDLDNLSQSQVHNGIVLETRPLTVRAIKDVGTFDSESGLYLVKFLDEIHNKHTTELRHCQRPGSFPVGIYADEITDPQNMGALVRTAYFLGADFIVVPEHNTARLGPITAKAAAGALDLMDVYQTNDSLGFLESLKKNGWNVVSTSSYTSQSFQEEHHNKHKKVQQELKKKTIEPTDLTSLASQAPMLLVMGSEGAGVRTTIQLRSDYLVGIPRGRENEGIVDSLNVSVASGLLLSRCVEKY